jgi:hypothetical protein
VLGVSCHASSDCDSGQPLPSAKTRLLRHLAGNDCMQYLPSCFTLMTVLVCVVQVFFKSASEMASTNASESREVCYEWSDGVGVFNASLVCFLSIVQISGVKCDVLDVIVHLAGTGTHSPIQHIAFVRLTPWLIC